MKLGAVTKIDKKNTVNSKKIDDDVMLVNSDAIVFFFIRQPDSGRTVYKTYILINNNP